MTQASSRMQNIQSKCSVRIQQLPHGAHLPLPDYATPQSAGVDLFAAIAEPIVLEPGKRALVPTGISIALPQGMEAQVRSRSGLAVKNGVVVLNSPGTIDADYRGEIIAILINHGDIPFTIEPGMRCAQMVIAPVIQVQWDEVPLLDIDETERGVGRFGSTGLTSF